MISNLNNFYLRIINNIHIIFSSLFILFSFNILLLFDLKNMLFWILNFIIIYFCICIYNLLILDLIKILHNFYFNFTIYYYKLYYSYENLIDFVYDYGLIYYILNDFCLFSYFFLRNIFCIYNKYINLFLKYDYYMFENMVFFLNYFFFLNLIWI